jgi:hypothetical protein
VTKFSLTYFTDCPADVRRRLFDCLKKTCVVTWILRLKTVKVSTPWTTSREKDSMLRRVTKFQRQSSGGWQAECDHSALSHNHEKRGRMNDHIQPVCWDLVTAAHTPYIDIVHHSYRHSHTNLSNSAELVSCCVQNVSRALHVAWVVDRKWNCFSLCIAGLIQTESWSICFLSHVRNVFPASHCA